MIKMTLNFILLGLVAVLAVWLADSGGLVSIEWIGYKSQLSMSAFIAFILLFSLAFIIVANLFGYLLKCLKFIKCDCLKIGNNKKPVIKNGEFVNIKNLDEGILSVFKTMGSISAGDMPNAIKNLKKVKRIFGSRPIIDILSLEIAKLEKDIDRIEKTSKRLIQYEDVEIIGLKAEIENYIEKKEFDKALVSANRAFEIRGDLPWVVEYTLNLRAKNREWDEALEVLKFAFKKKNISNMTFKKLKSIILFEKAKDFLKNGRETKYLKFCSEALSLNPMLTSASISLAKYYAGDDKQIRRASKILTNAWKKNPMDILVYEYVNLRNYETPLEKAQRVEKFVTLNRKLEPLNNKILAEYCIEAELWGKAKAEIEAFLITSPCTKKIAKMMAEYEEKCNGNTKEAEKWQAQIKSSADDNQWFCMSCGALSGKWQAICPICGDFGNHEWKMYVQDFEKDL